jgi:general secretion pathway protein I
MRSAESSRDGFTLLEVLVALAILGLGLTAILSAQAGLYASSVYTERVSYATGLVRCKMSEVELDLLKKGYPVIDSEDEGPCCNDEEYGGYLCKWKVQTVELPEPPLDGALDALGGGDSEGGGALGALGSLATLGKTGGASLGDSPAMADVAKLLAPPVEEGAEPTASQASMMAGSSALAPIVMSFVYPSLKPMLEASIRRVTVSVTWKDGSRERDLTVTQFVTNPQQGGLTETGAAAGAAPGVGGAAGGVGP